MKKIIPKQIIIEPTSRCNLKCKYCPNLFDGNEKDMDLEFFKSIIDRIDFDTTIIPWMNGEPLLYPDYCKILIYITDRNLRSYVQTNGTIWNEEVIQHATDENSIYQLNFSLDGLFDKKSKSIEIACPGSDRKRIQEIIEKTLSLKQKKKTKMDIGIKICERGQDYEEIEEYIKYWLDFGIDFVCVGKALTQINKQSMRIYPCQYPDRNFMVIRANGDVVWCAYNLEMVNEKSNIIGTLDKTTPLLDFYNNEKYTEFRNNQKKGIFPTVCQLCGFAYTGIGFEGVVRFRNADKQIYYHQDYYNQFFSYVKKWKPKEYYK